MPSLRNRFDVFMEGRAPKVPAISLELDERLRLLRRHGDFSLAYSTAVQNGLSYFGDSEGYIAFASKMGGHFALGDPVAAPEARQHYIRRFVEAARAPWFVQVGEDTARVLSGMGYRVNRMGIDTRLDLARHDFSGKPNETVRYSERWLFKKGYSIVEDDGSVASLDHVKKLSAEWLAERIVKRWEMRFLNRPFQPEASEGMRRFMLVDPDGQSVALLDFDPLYSGGDIAGYTTSFKRKLVGTTPHAEIGLTKFAVDRFRKEGHRIVTLGLSPLADIKPSGFSESGFWRTMFARAYDSKSVNSRIFNLQGQAAFKRRFHGAEEPTYIAFRKGSVMEMTGLLRLCKAI